MAGFSTSGPGGTHCPVCGSPLANEPSNAGEGLFPGDSVTRLGYNACHNARSSIDSDAPFCYSEGALSRGGGTGRRARLKIAWGGPP